jgi:hypothetical protein
MSKHAPYHVAHQGHYSKEAMEWREDHGHWLFVYPSNPNVIWARVFPEEDGIWHWSGHKSGSEANSLEAAKRAAEQSLVACD